MNSWSDRMQDIIDAKTGAKEKRKAALSLMLEAIDADSMGDDTATRFIIWCCIDGLRLDLHMDAETRNWLSNFLESLVTFFYRNYVPQKNNTLN